MIKVKLLTKTARMPERAHASDSGWDCFVDTEVRIKPGGWARVDFGFALEIPPGYEVQLRPRSSTMLVRGLHVVFGTIDQGYRGPMSAVVANIGEHATTVKVGERIAQIVVAKLAPSELVQVEELAPSERGDQGWGSSGR